jgi:CPA1 family monovalent cation:H+ antiporter
MFESLTVLIVLAAAVGFINHKFLKFPDAIGAMALTLAVSLTAIVAGSFFPPVRALANRFVEHLDFSEAVLHGMLGFLLFAGALHVNLNDLARFGVAIGALALASTFISTLIVGCLLWELLPLIGVELRFIECLLFGALISPTDPIAVLGIIRAAGISKSLEIKIVGESLLNDGVAVVIFLVLADIATGHAEPNAFHVLGLFAREALGGVAWGVIAGLVGYRLFKAIDNYQVEILMSLALAAGTFAAAERIGVSAPLAVVAAGLLIGNHGRSFAMSSTTVDHLDKFWATIDDILTNLFFVLIALEMLLIDLKLRYVAAGVLALVVVLLARWISIVVPAALLLRLKKLERGTLPILTWGALRGGLSVAMALSIPSQGDDRSSAARDAIIVMTWLVAAFSIIVQGLTVGPLARRWIKAKG